MKLDVIVSAPQRIQVVPEVRIGFVGRIGTFDYNAVVAAECGYGGSHRNAVVVVAVYDGARDRMRIVFSSDRSTPIPSLPNTSAIVLARLLSL